MLEDEVDQMERRGRRSPRTERTEQPSSHPEGDPGRRHGRLLPLRAITHSPTNNVISCFALDTLLFDRLTYFLAGDALASAPHTLSVAAPGCNGVENSDLSSQRDTLVDLYLLLIYIVVSSLL
jgi:hypothetical protein